jgi:DNA-binding NarL/FixJ family response regulator
MTVTVLLADDQALLRATFALLVNSAADLRVVGEAGTGAEAIELARSTRPDVILMDVRMPELDGIGATAAINEIADLADTRIIILTTFETEELVIDALRAGASAYLSKGVEPAVLLDAIRTVSAGDALLSPAATRALIGRVLAQPDRAPTPGVGLDQLTPREIEILTLVGMGLSNDEIAQRLTISPTTAKTHVNRTMTKLHARDRAQLVIAAYENSLVIPSDRRDRKR